MDILGVLTELCLETRDELARKYDVNNITSPTFRYRGLCNIASDMFKGKLDAYSERIYGGNTVHLYCIYNHGEQHHNSKILSRFWGCQHTWLQVIYKQKLYYVDPTCGQFFDLYDDIPPYYVSDIEPKWFYNDKDNWTFTDSKLLLRIFDFLVFGIHAHISDFIYFFRTRLFQKD